MNHLFHINVFSQISPAPSSPIEWWDIGVVAPSEGWNPSINKIRTAVATGLLALSLSAGAQEHPTTTVMAGTQPILLAQANIEDDRTWPYPVMIPQVNGWSKMVEYFRDIKGAIIAPPVKDGKLVDGSDAPGNPVEARVAQKKILVKYDKNAQINLALVSKEDIFWKAEKSLNEVLAITEKWGTISREQLINWFYSAYIVNISLGNWRWEKTISLLESIAKMKMKMNESETTQIKRDAEVKARNIWKSVTGAVA